MSIFIGIRYSDPKMHDLGPDPYVTILVILRGLIRNQIFFGWGGEESNFERRKFLLKK